MIKKAISDRNNLSGTTIGFYDVSYNDLISDRNNLATDLKAVIPAFTPKTTCKEIDFYLNRHTFNADSYGLDLNKIRDEFSFYYEEYGDYI